MPAQFAQKVSSALRRLLLLVCIVGIGYFVVVNYGYVFSHDVSGEIIEIERVTQPNAILGGAKVPDVQLYSFAVAIREFKGEIYTASSEDRKWAVAKKGSCVEARFYPYPPWNLEKQGTYFDARLTKMFDCPGGHYEAEPSAAPPPPAAAVSAPAASASPVEWRVYFQSISSHPGGR